MKTLDDLYPHLQTWERPRQATTKEMVDLDMRLKSVRIKSYLAKASVQRADLLCKVAEEKARAIEDARWAAEIEAQYWDDVAASALIDPLCLRIHIKNELRKAFGR